MNDILGIHNGWKKRWEWKDAESAGFWNDGGDLCHRQQLFDSSMCPFLPANLNKEKSERPSEEKSWRKISQEVTSNICHLQKPSSESERL